MMNLFLLRLEKKIIIYSILIKKKMKALIMFLTGTVGVILGGPLAIILVALVY